MSKQFHISTVLSVTTGKMLSLEGMSGIYHILNYLTGVTIYTHQIPRAMDACKPWLLQKYPNLADVNALGIDVSNLSRWVAEQEIKFGESLSLEPLPSFEYKDPVVEMVEMTGGTKPIIVVEE